MYNDNLLLASLDTAPVSSQHIRIYSLAIFGHLCDGFNINILAFALPALIVEFHISPPAAGALASAAFIGMLCGAILGGIVADRIGRKITILVALAIFSIAGVGCVVAPTYTALWTARLIAGFGLGAEIALITPYLAEFLPSRVRGVFISFASFFWIVTGLLAAVIAAYLSPVYGWRALFAVGAIIGFVSIVAWLFLPESVRYLIQKQRVEEAQRVVSRLTSYRPAVSDEHAARQSGSELASSTHRNLSSSIIQQILGRDYIRQTCNVWIVEFLDMFVFFGIAVWLPELFVKLGFTFVHGAFFSGVIAASGATGNIASGFLADRIGRRATLFSFLAIGGIVLILWGFARSESLILAGGIVGTFFTFGTIGPLFAYQSEIYPTHIRGSAVGFATAWGRLGGIVAPYVLGVLLGRGFTAHATFTFVGVLTIVAACVFGWLSIETKGAPLEQIGSRTRG